MIFKQFSCLRVRLLMMHKAEAKRHLKDNNDPADTHGDADDFSLFYKQIEDYSRQIR